MAKYPLSLNVNGEVFDVLVDAHEPLLETIREVIGLTGTKRACEDGRCGACTVLLNGTLVKSCLVLAAQCNGCEVTTVEGLAQDDQLTPVQEAFLDEGAVQCGYCISGMLLAAKALLDENPNPTEEQIRQALKGVLCRCGIYTNVTRAILSLAQR